MSQPWFFLASGPGGAAENMAWDEALLESVTGLGRPVLRCYGWLEPAATFGYFQRYAEIERMTSLRPLIRRPTGGGLVPHDADWTYSVVIPPVHAWYRLKAIESYHRVHDWIATALGLMRIEATLAAGQVTAAPGQCFAGAERFDVLWRQRKIAGAAQRRTRDGLLIQGSIQPPPGLDRAAFEDLLRRVARDEWDVEWDDLGRLPALTARAETLARDKYAKPSYNCRR